MAEAEINLTDLRIIHYPDPRLRRKCAPVTNVDDSIRQLAHRMFELMRESRGVGLAAPQVGVPLRLFVMNHTGDPADDRVIINPQIEQRSGMAEAEEGCLSIPGVNVQVRRPSRCRLVATDLDGNEVVSEADELQARVWQHESDHLDGVLIIDRMNAADRIAVRKILRGLEDGYVR